MIVLRDENGKLTSFVWVYGYSKKTREKLMNEYRKDGATVFPDKYTNDGFFVDYEHYEH
jgi:hypothetical protein